jgi:hypothetical protein
MGPEAGSFLKKRRSPPGGNQKTFNSYRRWHDTGADQHRGSGVGSKSFLLLFFQKRSASLFVSAARA